ncbi:MAG TPA: methylmalonyl-CoA mutase family protein [Desulfohalobiaceae bacterium]|nr:methylmalonyl-CoA mutase family protein [Desulfohalobiaceae bacterium]
MGKNPRLEQWEEDILAKALNKFPERSPEFKTVGGVELKRLGLPKEIDKEYLEQLGFPGEYPFTRGVQPTMYRSRLWTMRQYAGFSTAKETNKRYRYLLEQGQTGLSVAFDLPTQIGYDSDHHMSKGEVGKVGVAIDSLADMEVLFDQIPLEQVSTSMTINSPAAIVLAMYVVVGEKQGVPMDKLKGTIQNDVLKEYVSRGTFIFPPRPSLRLITDIFGWCSQNTPAFNTISISGYHMREAGSTAAQEIAFTLANGCTYVQTALDAGLDLDTFAKRLSFFFCATTDIMEEVAKFRAARRMWSKIMKERFGAKNPRSWMLRFHTQTAGHTLTAQQIDNNVVRVALQALAAVLGGTQSLHTNSKDEALTLPTEDSVRTALRTQQIIAHESGVANSIDVLGGSYLLEDLTDKIEEKAWELMNKVEEMGGVIPAIEQGFIQRQIEDAAYDYQMKIENKERIMVGVNEFQSKEDIKVPLLRIDPDVERNQVARVQEVRENRDAKKVSQALNLLQEAAQGDEALMPHIMEAVRQYATVGEICDVLRGIFGEHRE